MCMPGPVFLGRADSCQNRLAAAELPDETLNNKDRNWVFKTGRKTCFQEIADVFNS